MQLALIVDDSKTARVMLRKMLDRLNIPTAMVESGEEALEYLKTNRPDVIFMDHMMPGMDGFAAVKAIKADPDKSSIPIVMHTTQQGDIYVGQARALGAMDILSKPTTDQDLKQVLDRVSHSNDTLAENVQVVDPVEPPKPLRQAGALNLADSTATVEMPAVPDAGSDKVSFIGSLRQWLIALVWLIPSLWLLSLYLVQQQEISALQQDRRALFQGIEWLANQQPGYDYGEQPMSESRLEMLSRLVSLLQESGFKGVVRIEGHIGEFCLSQLVIEDGSEVLMLPPPDSGLTECDVIGTSQTRAMRLSIGQSPAFASFVRQFNDQQTGIEIELIPYGASSPLYPYPVDITDVSTGDWNAIALNNNRIQILLIEK